MIITNAQRERLIEKLLEIENEELFNLLNLDMDYIFRAALDAKTDEQLLTLHLDNF